MRIFLVTLCIVVAASAFERQSTCPPLWTLYRGNCYRFFNEDVTWDQAETKCQLYFTEHGMAHLASIHDESENAFVYEMFRSSSKYKPYVSSEPLCGMWTGLFNTAANAPWKWTDGTPTNYTNWNAGEPNNNAKACAEIRGANSRNDAHTGKNWNDHLCDGIVTSYVCKMTATTDIARIC